jgi:hypothetical protein
MNMLARRAPMVHRLPEYLDGLDASIERHTVHHLGMRELAASATDFPIPSSSSDHAV